MLARSFLPLLVALALCVRVRGTPMPPPPYLPTLNYTTSPPPYISLPLAGSVVGGIGGSVEIMFGVEIGLTVLSANASFVNLATGARVNFTFHPNAIVGPMRLSLDPGTAGAPTPTSDAYLSRTDGVIEWGAYEMEVSMEVRTGEEPAFVDVTWSSRRAFTVAPSARQLYFAVDGGETCLVSPNPFLYCASYRPINATHSSCVSYFNGAAVVGFDVMDHESQTITRELTIPHGLPETGEERYAIASWMSDTEVFVSYIGISYSNDNNVLLHASRASGRWELGNPVYTNSMHDILRALGPTRGWRDGVPERALLGMRIDNTTYLAISNKIYALAHAENGSVSLDPSWQVTVLNDPTPLIGLFTLYPQAMFRDEVDADKFYIVSEGTVPITRLSVSNASDVELVQTSIVLNGAVFRVVGRDVYFASTGVGVESDAAPPGYVADHLEFNDRQVNFDVVMRVSLDELRITHLKYNTFPFHRGVTVHGYHPPRPSTLFVAPEARRISVLFTHAVAMEFTLDLEPITGASGVFGALFGIDDTTNLDAERISIYHTSFCYSRLRVTPLPPPPPVVVAPEAGSSTDNDAGRISYVLYSAPEPGSVRLVTEGVAGDPDTVGEVVVFTLPDVDHVDAPLGELLANSSVEALALLDRQHALREQAVAEQAVVANVTRVPFRNGTYRIQITYRDADTGEPVTMEVGNVTLYQSYDTGSTVCSGRGYRTMSRCTCTTPGWFGPSCADSAGACSAQYCVSGEACSQTVFGAFRCDVQPCECAGAGVCRGDGRCTCAEGFRGASCEFTAAECAEVVCLNAGNCTETVDGVYGCSAGCAGGCGLGVCSNAGVCVCDDAHTGAACETPLPPCANSTDGRGCGGGTCGVGGCTCPSGSFGRACNLTASACSASVCGGLLCSATVNGSIACTAPVCGPGVLVGAGCTCPLGFFGPVCAHSADACAAEFCDAGAFCTPTEEGAFTCIDPAPPVCSAGDCSCAYGDACDLTQDECDATVCGGHGVCREVGSNACTCTTGRFGGTCSLDLAECTAEHCAAGQQCAGTTNEGLVVCDYVQAPVDARDRDKDLSAPAIAGIVVGSTVAFVGIIVCGLKWIRVARATRSPARERKREYQGL